MRIVSLSISALVLVLAFSACNSENKEESILQYSDHMFARLSEDDASVATHKDEFKAAVEKFVANADKSDLPVADEIAEFLNILISEALAVAKDGKESLRAVGVRHVQRFQKLQRKAEAFRIGTKAAQDQLMTEFLRLGIYQLFSNFYVDLGLGKKSHGQHGHNHGHSHGHYHGHTHTHGHAPDHDNQDQEDEHVHDEHCHHDHDSEHEHHHH